MEVETIVTLVAGILAVLGILPALVGFLKSLEAMVMTTWAVLEDGNLTAEEKLQLIQKAHEVKSSSYTFWKTVLKLFGKG